MAKRRWKLGSPHPSLAKFVRQVESGKIDIGLKVEIRLVNGSIYKRPIKTKTPRVNRFNGSEVR